MPTRFADFLPGSATHLAHMPLSDRQQCVHHHDAIMDQHTNPQPHMPSPQQSEHADTPIFIPFETEANEAGLYRIYPTRPSVHYNENTLESVTDAPTLAGDDRIPSSSRVTEGLSSGEIGQDDLYAAFHMLLLAYSWPIITPGPVSSPSPSYNVSPLSLAIRYLIAVMLFCSPIPGNQRTLIHTCRTSPICSMRNLAGVDLLSRSDCLRRVRSGMLRLKLQSSKSLVSTVARSLTSSSLFSRMMLQRLTI
jgi:hypothetical protein